MDVDDFTPQEDVELCCWAEGLVVPGVKEQIVPIEANGIALDTWRFTLTHPEGQFRTRVPSAVWRRGGELHIVLRPHRPTTPRWSLDDRQRGVSLRALQLRQVPADTVQQELALKSGAVS
jgi:hypothetical protein